MTFLENVDKAKLQKILLITISALMLVALALLLAIVIMSIEPASLTEADIEFTDYTVKDKDVATGSLILADKNHPYTPNEELLELVGCTAYMEAQPDATGVGSEDFTEKNYIPWKVMRLPTLTMQSLHNMLTAAKNEVEEDPITIDGAYDTIISGDVYAEYATGMLVLLSDYTSSYTRVELSSAYRAWLDKNAARYGFVEAYEDTYRFVGVAHAKYLNDAGITLAGYISYLKENTNNEKGLELTCADGAKYYVYYVACEEGETIKVPANNAYTISGTNAGGVVVTVSLDK